MDKIEFRLPNNLRDKLKEPLGFLIDDKEIPTFLNNEKYIVSIGDQVTYNILKNNILPIFCIIDYKTKRKPCSNDTIKVLKSFGKKYLTIENPPKCITSDLWNAIENAYIKIEKNALRIEIIGEEDLTALPAIFLAPRDVTIIYGLPNKGVVIVKANNQNKSKVKKILDMM